MIKLIKTNGIDKFLVVRECLMGTTTRYLSANTGVYAQCTLEDGRAASVYLNLVNTVCTTSWPMGLDSSCLEHGNSVHTGSQGSFIKLMFVNFDGRDRCSVLPFEVSSSVNITTVTNEGTREWLASGYDVLQQVGFGKTRGRCSGFANKNCNYSALLHGVLNRTDYIDRLLKFRGLKFSRNAFFPRVKFAMETETEQVVQVQIYPPSLAVNLQNLTQDTVVKYGPVLLKQIICEADIDTSLMRFCVDTECRLDRFLSPAEKFQLVVGYYSLRWLEATVVEFDVVGEMHQFICQTLRLFSTDYGRYWYSFERQKRVNREIHDFFVEDTPLRRCPHASHFRAFVVSYLTSRGHSLAARAIVDNFPSDAHPSEKRIDDPSVARHWFDTHVIDYRCLYREISNNK